MKKRAIALAALTVGLSGLASTPAAQAETNTAVQQASQQTAASARLYWRIRNEARGGCLTAWSSGAVRVRPCSATEQSQQWHWINSSWNGDYRLLANRWTGTCLRRTNQAADGWSADTVVVVDTGSCDDWTSRHWARSSSSPATIWADGSWSLDAPSNDNVRASRAGVGASAWWTFHDAN